MKKYIQILFWTGLCAVIAYSHGAITFADPPGTGSPMQFPNPLNVPSITCLVVDILKIVANIGAFISVFFIIYSGFLFVTAQGDVSKIKTAKANFLYTIIGTAILLGAWGLSSVIAVTISQISNLGITSLSCDSSSGSTTSPTAPTQAPDAPFPGNPGQENNA